MAKTLEFWFDFASSYSYLSAMRVEKEAADRGVDVVWKPFLLGPIFAKQGWTSSPFVIYPAKGRYMVQDIKRLADLRGLPFVLPKEAPARSMLANRIGLAVLDYEWGVCLCKAIFQAEFGEGLDIADEAVLGALIKQAGQEPATIFEKALSADNKQKLKEQTAEAETLGIFGAPAFITPEKELFWGDDRLDQALDLIAGDR